MKLNVGIGAFLSLAKFVTVMSNSYLLQGYYRIVAALLRVGFYASSCL